MTMFVHSVLGKLRNALLILPLAWLVAGCESTQPPATTRPTGSTPAPQAGGTNENRSPDLLSPGNKITITFSETSSPPPPHEETIREDGRISPPHVGDVVAAGKTAGELQQELHKLYVPTYFKRLTVTVKTEQRFFTVTGEVRTPSLQPYMGEMTVLKGVAAAGGFTDFAKKSKVVVFRTGKAKGIPVDCAKAQNDPSFDIPIYPGDLIRVPRRIW